MKNLLQLLLLTLAMWASQAMAGTITVTSPNNGDFLGRTNVLRFNITGSIVRARVRATVTFDADPNIRTVTERDFNPDNENRITGSIDLNFAETFPEGDYTIVVTVSEPNNPYNTETRNVKIDVRKPEFREFQPTNGAFVRGIVNIRAQLLESNIREYRVRVNDQDIPNNALTAPNAPEETYLVPWDTNGIRLDGEQVIKLRAEDLANNNNETEITVTLDRIPPTATIVSPRPGTPIRPRANIPVSIDIRDVTDKSIDLTGVDVIVRTIDGQYIQRVARRSTRFNAEIMRWVGRIRWTPRLPNRFKIVITAVDRAGNAAVAQEVEVNVVDRGRGR
jgi:hypothetical protein